MSASGAGGGAGDGAVFGAGGGLSDSGTSTILIEGDRGVVCSDGGSHGISHGGSDHAGCADDCLGGGGGSDHGGNDPVSSVGGGASTLGGEGGRVGGGGEAQTGGIEGLCFGYVPVEHLNAAIAAGFVSLEPTAMDFTDPVSSPRTPGSMQPAPQIPGVVWSGRLFQNLGDEVKDTTEEKFEEGEEFREDGISMPGSARYAEIVGKGQGVIRGGREAKGGGKHQAKPGSVLRGGRDPMTK